MTTAFDECWRYIKRIRNMQKREYAIQYLEYLRAYRRDDPEPDGISLMAAQGVRLQLHKLLHSERYTSQPSSKGGVSPRTELAR